MKTNVYGTRLDEAVSDKLEGYSKEKSWTPSQAIREIVTLFFKDKKARAT